MSLDAGIVLMDYSMVFFELLTAVVVCLQLGRELLDLKSLRITNSGNSVAFATETMVFLF